MGAALGYSFPVRGPMLRSSSAAQIADGLSHSTSGAPRARRSIHRRESLKGDPTLVDDLVEGKPRDNEYHPGTRPAGLGCRGEREVRSGAQASDSCYSLESCGWTMNFGR